MTARPLDKFPAIRTTDVDDAREAIAARNGANCLQVSPHAKGFSAYTNFLPLNNIGLAYATFGTAVTQQFRTFNAFGQQFRIRGTSEAIIDRKPVELAPHHSAVFSPGESPKFNYSADFAHCVLRIAPAAVTNKLEALTGVKPRSNLRFEPIADLNSPEAASLQQLFAFYIAQLGASDSAIPPLVMVELEQAIITSFVCVNRHSESYLFDKSSRSVAPWQVTRVEEYIEAHWDQPITVEALVVVTNASARSIYQSFKDCRGYSPMMFVKQVRLNHARRMLMMRQEESSVTGVAYRCGFSNLGHFSKDYRECFGELPSETLNRAKGAGAPPRITTTTPLVSAGPTRDTRPLKTLFAA